jgi:hypothetical protein
MNPSLWLVAVQGVGCRVIGAWLVIYMRLSSALCVYPLFICELAWSGMEWTGLGLFLIHGIYMHGMGSLGMTDS